MRLTASHVAVVAAAVAAQRIATLTTSDVAELEKVLDAAIGWTGTWLVIEDTDGDGAVSWAELLSQVYAALLGGDS